jgi:hypothetical protein
MGRRPTRALAVALGLMVAIAAPPADAAVQIIGAGISSCATWTTDRAARDVGALQEEAWVEGFLSGAAVWSPDLDPMKKIDAPAVFAWMDNYCQALPLVSIVDAANAFLKEHAGR